MNLRSPWAMLVLPLFDIADEEPLLPVLPVAVPPADIGGADPVEPDGVPALELPVGGAGDLVAGPDVVPVVCAYALTMKAMAMDAASEEARM